MILILFQRADFCKCVSDSVRLDMGVFVKKYTPDRWLEYQESIKVWFFVQDTLLCFVSVWINLWIKCFFETKFSSFPFFSFVASRAKNLKAKVMKPPKRSSQNLLQPSGTKSLMYFLETFDSFLLDWGRFYIFPHPTPLVFSLISLLKFFVEFFWLTRKKNASGGSSKRPKQDMERFIDNAKPQVWIIYLAHEWKNGLIEAHRNRHENLTLSFPAFICTRSIYQFIAVQNHFARSYVLCHLQSNRSPLYGRSRWHWSALQRCCTRQGQSFRWRYLPRGQGSLRPAV